MTIETLPVPVDAELFLGPIDLIGLPGGDSPFRIEALSTDEGTTWGNADAIDVEMRSFLQHGSLVVTEGWENRTLMLAVSTSGSSADGPASAEALLIGQLHKPNLVTYKPRTATVRTVFPVLTSTLVPVDNDLNENYDGEIEYQIRLTCRPFARGAELVTVEALPPDDVEEFTETIEDITTGSTGWTGEVIQGGSYLVHSLSVETYGVRVATAAWSYPQPVMLAVKKTYPTVDSTVMHYVVVDWKVTGAATPPQVRLQIAPGSVYDDISPVASIVSPDDPTFTRSVFETTGIDSFTFFQLWATASFHSGPPALIVGQIVQTNVNQTGTAKQQIRRLDLHGTMPTTGSVEISHEEDPLGEVLFYTCRGNSGTYNPACRPHIMTVGTADVDAVSGAHNVLTDEPLAYEITNSALPEGDYVIVARMAVAEGANLSIKFRGEVVTLMNDYPVGPTHVFADDVLVTDILPKLLVDPSYALAPVGELHLPVTLAQDGPLSKTAIYISEPADSGNLRIDDLFLLNLTTGQYTQVSCGFDPPEPGWSSNRLWIDSPDIGNNGQPQIWRGTDPDRADAVGAWVDAEAVDIHEFDPQVDVTTFLISTGTTTPPAVRFSYYPAYWYRAYPLEGQT